MSLQRLAITAVAVLMFGLLCGASCLEDLGIGQPSGGNGSNDQQDLNAAPQGTYPRVRITVEYTPADGDGAAERRRANFIIELNDALAPLSVANFLAYVDADFYDGTVFHRADRNVHVVQAGGYEVDDADAGDDNFTSETLVAKPPLFDPVDNEAFNGLLNLRGSVGMARSNDPDSATSQWYINTVDNAALDPSAGNAGYAIFGKVVGGMSVVDELQAVDVESRDSLQNVPVETITLVRAARVGSAKDVPETPEGGTAAKTQARVSVAYTTPGGLRKDGSFVIELEDELAPLSTANFLAYVDADFYDNTVIHRVDAELGVVQGGGFEVDESAVTDPHDLVSQPIVEKEPLFDPIQNEADNGLLNVRGSVGVARTSDPDSGTSQWYINTVDNPGFDPAENPPGYAIFGTVIEGMDVVDEIQEVIVESRGGLTNVPVETVLVTSVERVE